MRRSVRPRSGFVRREPSACSSPSGPKKMRRPAGVWRSRSTLSARPNCSRWVQNWWTCGRTAKPASAYPMAGCTTSFQDEPAELGLGLPVGAQAPRHGDGLVPDVVHAALQDEAEAVARLALHQVRPHVGARGGGRAPVKVDERVDAAIGQIEVQAAEPGDARHQRVDDPLHQRARHRRVHGVAAGPQRLRARLDGLRLRRHDHAAPSGAHRAAGMTVVAKRSRRSRLSAMFSLRKSKISSLTPRSA